MAKLKAAELYFLTELAKLVATCFADSCGKLYVNVHLRVDWNCSSFSRIRCKIAESIAKVKNIVV